MTFITLSARQWNSHRAFVPNGATDRAAKGGTQAALAACATPHPNVKTQARADLERAGPRAHAGQHALVAGS
ncbi:MAG: hypothetical protein M3N82_03715 [Pseudomonadota bacterium]|nr:hypothetical protein [Pseudomonadota bacterium]